MSEESTTADLVELMHKLIAADNEQDLDALTSFYSPHAVWDLGDLGLGLFEGAAAIRALVTGWWSTWQDHHLELDEIVDLGHGVAYAAVREDCRVPGSDRSVEQRRGRVVLYEHGKIARVTIYLQLDDARAAAEHLAEERE
jgi:ketosteroid isomerase-like protein